MIRSHHDLPRPVFVGFFPKLTMQAPTELAAAGVVLPERLVDHIITPLVYFVS
ncbi:MAG TPA: hypothetical protein VE974_29295 [Thermoanaerobaculia bacterium]|nr:hypothetical protein [Thermoanaerobaculia bacterium]